MKIRTDFVTNSSSSSFTVRLKVSTTREDEIWMEVEESDGDYEGIDMSFGTGEGASNLISLDMEEVYIPDLGLDPDDDESHFLSTIKDHEGIGTDKISLNLNRLVSCGSAEEIVDLISGGMALADVSGITGKEPGRGKTRKDYTRKNYENYTRRFRRDLRERIQDPSDIKGASLSVQAESSSVHQYSVFDVLRPFFGSDVYRVVSLAEKGADVGSLMRQPFFKNFSRSSVEAMVNYIREKAFWSTKITETLTDTGRIYLSIGGEDYRDDEEPDAPGKDSLPAEEDKGENTASGDSDPDEMSEEELNEGVYKIAVKLKEAGLIMDAIRHFVYVIDYKDTEEKLVEITGSYDALADLYFKEEIAKTHDIDVKVDVDRAVRYWTKGAEKGETESQTKLAALYLNGDKVEKDFDKAYRYAKMAADAGNAAGYYIIGLMYCNGEIADKGMEDGIACFEKAADLGLKQAAEILEEIREEEED